MPSKHVVRQFAENKYYHVFNSGVEKRKIFLDKQDFQMFMYYVSIYLLPLKIVIDKYPNFPPRLQSKNLNQELELNAYCLMPNHFHFLLRQKSRDAVSRFIKQLMDGYTKYFNEKYQRVGSLMQGRFKAVLIETEELLVHLSRYIHLNPVVANLAEEPKDYIWSSYPSYLEIKEEKILHKKAILDYFRSKEQYQDFVQNQVAYTKNLEKIKHHTIEP